MEPAKCCLLCPAIELDKGYRTLVDVEDWVSLDRTVWRTKRFKGRIYAVRYHRDKGKSKCEYLHRKVKNSPAGFDEHHRNRYTLDNRKANLQTLRPKEHRNLEAAYKISGIIGGKARFKNQRI